MKAIVYDRYGGPDVLRPATVDAPSIGDDEVLIRVRAASPNVLDWRVMRADPFFVRISGGGLLRPKQPILGVDTAGVIEAVGKKVSALRTGDEVFGIGVGSFAEYTTGKHFAPKPASLTFEQAAALPIAGTTALQSLRDKGNLQPGQHVLVNGAGGGVGSLTVQIAKALGARVTATTRPDKLDHVGGLGADRVLDYTKTDLTRGEDSYDLIVEVGRDLRFSHCKPSLAPGGRVMFVGAGSGVGGPIGRLVNSTIREKLLRQPVHALISKESTEALEALAELVEAGKVEPPIDRTYELSETADAIRYLESGDVRGKVVITVA